MVRFGLSKTSWITIGLSSIALHLALLSTLPVIQSEELIEVALLPTVEINQLPKPNRKVLSPPIRQAIASGATQSAEVGSTSKSSLNYFRESLYRALDEKLQMRSKSLEVLLSLTFSNEGVLERSEILKGSGQSLVDAEIINILMNSPLHKAPELANLKIQVPVRLR